MATALHLVDQQVRRLGRSQSVAPGLTDDPAWPSLAASLDRAEQTGYDVGTRLPALVANNPLPAGHVARNVEFRLAEAWPGSIPARDRTTFKPSQPEGCRQPINPAVPNPRPVRRSTTQPSP